MGIVYPSASFLLGCVLGWEVYQEYPFISKELDERLLSEKVALVGVDTVNIDNYQYKKNPYYLENASRR